jgi:hypothetical protein
LTAAVAVSGTHETAEARRRQHRALGTVAVALVGVAGVSSAVALAVGGRIFWALLIAAAAAFFTARAHIWRIVGNDRREAVAHALVATALGAIVVVHAGAAAGLPILLLPPIFLGGFDFGHWQVGRSDDSLRSLAMRSSRLSGSIPVIGGAYVGAAALMADGHPLAAASEQLVAPWLYLMPALTIFLSSWHGLAAEFARVRRGTVSIEVDERLHTLIGSATRAIEDVRDAALPLHVDGAVLKRLESAIQRSRTATDRAFINFGYSPEVVPSKPELSFLSGAGHRTRPSSFATARPRALTKLKSTWPLTFVTTLRTKAANTVAAWKALHNEQIEWVTLYATLWLRAALVLAAPALSGISYAPTLPSSYRDWGWRVAIWWLAAFWCAITAIGAPAIVPWLELRSSARPRRVLIAVETLIVVPLLIALPAWPTAAFAAGLMNLLQRPEWTPKRLAVLTAGVACTFGIGVAIHWSGWSITGLAIEVVIAAAVLTIISCSYGLMAPLLVRATALLPLELKLHRSYDRSRIQEFAVRQSGQAVGNTERLVAPLLAAFPDDEPLRVSSERLTQARIRLADPDAAASVSSRYGVLDRVALGALLRVVPQQGAEPGSHIHAYEPMIDPPPFGRARLRREYQRPLRRAISEIAREADDHGTGRLKTIISLDGQRASVVMANEVGSARPKGRSRGEELIRRAVTELPAGSLDSRGLESGTRLFGDKDAFVVRFSFSTTAFRRLAGGGS